MGDLRQKVFKGNIVRSPSGFRDFVVVFNDLENRRQLLLPKVSRLGVRELTLPPGVGPTVGVGQDQLLDLLVRQILCPAVRGPPINEVEAPASGVCEDEEVVEDQLFGQLQLRVQRPWVRQLRQQVGKDRPHFICIQIATVVDVVLRVLLRQQPQCLAHCTPAVAQRGQLAAVQLEEPEVHKHQELVKIHLPIVVRVHVFVKALLELAVIVQAPGAQPEEDAREVAVAGPVRIHFHEQRLQEGERRGQMLVQRGLRSGCGLRRCVVAAEVLILCYLHPGICLARLTAHGG
mmetsp:Transcript_87546/g.152417  ORF Transcript_87546/g.152417 Transcript_87546/m.152417 type:complete len:290 (-) Transcript_87546:48-917(-)